MALRPVRQLFCDGKQVHAHPYRGHTAAVALLVDVAADDLRIRYSQNARFLESFLGGCRMIVALRLGPPLVAALRESSVLFATLISTLLLREPWLAARIAATVMVLAGALLLRVR